MGEEAEIITHQERFARSVSAGLRRRGRAVGRRGHFVRHRSARSGREGRTYQDLQQKVCCFAAARDVAIDVTLGEATPVRPTEDQHQQHQQHELQQQQRQNQHSQQQLNRPPQPPRSPHQQQQQHQRLLRSPASSPPQVRGRHPLPASPWTPLLENSLTPADPRFGRLLENPLSPADQRFGRLLENPMTPADSRAGMDFPKTFQLARGEIPAVAELPRGSSEVGGTRDGDAGVGSQQLFPGFVPFVQHQQQHRHYHHCFHQSPLGPQHDYCLQHQQHVQQHQACCRYQTASGRQPPASPPTLRTPQVRAPLSSPSAHVTGTPTPSGSQHTATSSAAARNFVQTVTPSISRVPFGSPLLALTTPEPRPVLTAPPQAPNQLRDRLELEEDIATALEWQSEPLLTMTLLRQHNSKCTKAHALHEAIALQHVGAVTFLLEFGHDLEEPCQNCRPLARAVRNSSSDGDTGHRIVQLLLERGAKVDAPMLDISGDTVTHHAASRCHQGLLLTLLQYRADPNTRNSRGRTPLHLACSPHAAPQLGRTEAAVVEMLLEFGADPRLEDENGFRPCDMLGPRFPNGMANSHPSWVLLTKAQRWLDRSPAVLVRAHRRTDFLEDVPMWYDLPEMIFRTIILFL